MLGDVTISDLHDRWIENGENEFVPGVVAGSAAMDFMGIPGGYGNAHGGRKPVLHGARGQPLPSQMVAAYQMGLPHPQYGMVQGTWVPVGPGMPPEGMVPSWHFRNHGHMLGVSSPMLQPGSASSQPKATAKTYVAAWNFQEEYTETELRQQLLDIDFHPDDVWACPAIHGAFILRFADSWHANALIVSLDGTSEHLSPCTGETLRLAKWSMEPPMWSADDVPAELQREAQSLVHFEQS
mmetsp:Transcript_123042/g.244909  ORF Transcript_123042/g.244909 Transcript_123042/m.244909 type:complete len:239 (-) Transcript_123042:91-807(-)